MPLSDGDWQLGMTATGSTPDEIRRGNGPFHAEFQASNRDAGIEVRLGEGSGAHALMGASGRTAAPTDLLTGGVNPILGFYRRRLCQRRRRAGARPLSSTSASRRLIDHTEIDPVFGPLKDVPLATNRASASVAGIEYKLADGVTANASYTRLNEADGLLGSQGSGVACDGDRARNEGTTVGVTTRLGGWSLSGSADLAQVRQRRRTVSRV